MDTKLYKFLYRKPDETEREAVVLVLDSDENYIRGIDFERLDTGTQVQLVEALSELNNVIDYAINTKRAFRTFKTDRIQGDIEKEMVQ